MLRPSFPFWKMEAAGNDFVVVYRADLPPDTDSELAVAVCDRHFGVGADGILVVGVGDDVEPASLRGRAALSMTVWNADGSVSEMCGNGLRCVVLRAMQDGRWAPGADARGVMAAATGLVPFEVVHGEVRVTLAPPRLDGVVTTIEAGGRTVRGVLVDMGNPHFVVFDADQPEPLPDLHQWAPALEVHSAFPRRTNVEHALESDTGWTVRVWERGVGETLACGSGACAVAAAARRTGRSTADNAALDLPGGRLSVFWRGRDGDPIDLQGPARSVFAGTWRPGEDER